MGSTVNWNRSDTQFSMFLLEFVFKAIGRFSFRRRYLNKCDYTRLGTPFLDLIYKWCKQKVQGKKLYSVFWENSSIGLCLGAPRFLVKGTLGEELSYCKLPKLFHIWHSFEGLNFWSFSFGSDGTESKKSSSLGRQKKNTPVHQPRSGWTFRLEGSRWDFRHRIDPLQIRHSASSTRKVKNT